MDKNLYEKAHTDLNNTTKTDTILLNFMIKDYEIHGIFEDLQQ